MADLSNDFDKNIAGTCPVSDEDWLERTKTKTKFKKKL